ICLVGIDVGLAPDFLSNAASPASCGLLAPSAPPLWAILFTSARSLSKVDCAAAPSLVLERFRFLTDFISKRVCRKEDAKPKQARRSAAVPGCEFEHGLGACSVPQQPTGGGTPPKLAGEDAGATTLRGLSRLLRRRRTE